MRFQQPPYTDTRELMADLRAQAGPEHQGLITDFFDKITLFDDRMTSATAKKLSDGKYDVTLQIHAAKFYADGKGKETPAKVDIPIKIGVFAKAKSGEDQDEEPLYGKVAVADGDSTITVVVDGEPYKADIDPFNELIDRVSDGYRAAMGPDIWRTIASQGYNHVENTSGGTFTVISGDIAGTDPQLWALANNGGRTLTHLPATSSPVINSIPNGTSDCGVAVVTSQNGVTRPYAAGCEKGAAEVGEPPLFRNGFDGI